MITARKMSTLREGTWSWRNPLALTLYCWLLSGGGITVTLYAEKIPLWAWMIAVPIWVFTTVLSLFCIISAFAARNERNKRRRNHSGREV
jgi:hypothetical protein